MYISVYVTEKATTSSQVQINLKTQSVSYDNYFYLIISNNIVETIMKQNALGFPDYLMLVCLMVFVHATWKYIIYFQGILNLGRSLEEVSSHFSI